MEVVRAASPKVAQSHKAPNQDYQDALADDYGHRPSSLPSRRRACPAATYQPPALTANGAINGERSDALESLGAVMPETRAEADSSARRGTCCGPAGESTEIAQVSELDSATQPKRLQSRGRASETGGERRNL